MNYTAPILLWLVCAYLSFIAWERRTYNSFSYDPSVKAERVGRRIGLAICIAFAPVMALIAILRWIIYKCNRMRYERWIK